MIGKRVNNFDITRLLGEGGMGAVYEATHSIISRRVAIKVLRREYAVDSALVQRFFNEARATHAIRHPNIVEIIDVGMLPEGVPYLIMELLEGESLAQRVAREGKLELATAIDFVAQVAEALEPAHAAGIVHRDIKPDHLFLVQDPKQPEREMVKVLDFGIAKLRTNLSMGKVTTNAGTILGTPAYMSPEQCRGVAEGVDHRADVYALGITLYELLCGVPPFVGRGIGDVMMLHMGVAPEPPSRHRAEVPKELDAIVLKALAKAPDERFQSMSEMATALRGCLGGERASPERPDRAAAPALFRPAPRSTTPSNLAVPKPRSTPARWSRRTTLLALGSVVLAGLGGQAVLRHNGSRPVSALDGDALDHQNLRLRGEGSGAAASPAASVAAPSASARAHSAPPAAASPAAPSASSPPPPASIASAVTAARPAAVAPSSTARTEPALTAADGAGFLSLDSVPWANVYMGGRMLGTTPLDRVPLPAGRQALRLENPELHAATDYVVLIESGRLVTRFVDWNAKPEPSTTTP